MRKLSDIANLKEKIGGGWAGIVYTAVLISDSYGLAAGSEIAVKLYRPSIFVEAGDIIKKRINRESFYSRKRLSPRLIQSYELVEAEVDGIPSIALIMDLVKGFSLDEYVQGNYPLKTKEQYEITCDLFDAIKSLHSEGIIHRDIKPQNVMISSGRATLMDLGAIKVPAHYASASISLSNEFLGTIRYAEKEYLFEGLDDEYSDSWSLGMTLFHMLYGHPPFEDTKRFPDWITAIDKGIINFPSGKDRFGSEYKVYHIFIESAMMALLKPRKERTIPLRMQFSFKDREKCKFYIDHLEILGAKVLKNQNAHGPWPVFIPWALYRVKNWKGHIGLERLSCCNNREDIMADDELREKVAVSYPSPENFEYLSRDEKKRVASLTAGYLYELATDRNWREMFGGILLPHQYFKRLLKNESDEEVIAHLEPLSKLEKYLP